MTAGIEPVLDVAPLGRRRRPSGEPPPLPRRIDPSTQWLAVVTAVTVVLGVGLSITPAMGIVTRIDLAVLRAIARVRTGAVTTVMRQIDHVDADWMVITIAAATAVTLLILRRFQHLATYTVIVLTDGLVVSLAPPALGRMRPAGIEILGHWDGYSHPSRPVALLTLVLVGIAFTLLPTGRRRRQFGWAAAVVLGVLAAARLYLAVDHPTDVLAALVAGGAIPIIAFRLVVPDEVFPVRGRRRQPAHLDVGGRRGDAIVAAFDQQLGHDVLDIEPCGLEGSAGSTPLRIGIRHADGQPAVVFAKLYALNHLRSDRWYKLVRAARYGRLEDEKPFSTVRRLVEYEDHLLRLLRDAGLPTPQPFGFVEITPEREYVIAMEFFDGADEIGSVALNDAQIDSGLSIVRRLWDAGVAHRDIKPSNLLVRGDDVLLIDVAFGAVRPTPWRQAVDLANMMLTLALSSSAARVYERALRQFAPDDIAEAFAASRSITIPTQLRNRLRSRLRADGTDIAAELRALAPPRPPVAIQLWTVRRVTVALAVVAIAAAAALLGLATARTAGGAASGSVPKCQIGSRLGLVAQSVPSASYVPCLAHLPEGWDGRSFRAVSGHTRFSLLSDRAGGRAVTVTLRSRCDIKGASFVGAERGSGAERYARLESIAPRYRGTWMDVFPGGCVSYRFDLQRGPHIPLLEDLDAAVDLFPRSNLAAGIHRRLGVEISMRP